MSRAGSLGAALLWLGVFLMSAPARADDAPAAAAAQTFAARCASCHGADGKGHTAVGRGRPLPDFTDAAWRRQHPASEMATAIAQGVSGTAMPPFKSVLSQAEVTTLVAYLRTLGAR